TRGGAVMVVGSGGSGKSALLGEVGVRARRSGLAVWRLQGRFTERDVPGAALQELLGATAVVDGAPDPAVAAHRASRALLDVCAGPGYLIVDDAHLLDDLALRALATVAERWHGDDRWLVVAQRPANR